MASRTLRRTGQILTGLAALLALIVLLVGVPAGLALLGGNPLPEQLPTWPQAFDTLMRPDDGTLFIAVLTVIGWIAWAAFAVPIMVEAVARLRGIRTPRLPGLSAPQRVAAGLLAAVSLVIASPAVAATTGTPAYANAPTTAISAAVVEQHTTAAPHQPATTTPPAIAATTETTSARPVAAKAETADAGSSTYTVRRGDHLSAISDRVLGDASAYPQLAELNKERIDDPDLIQPGWKLKLPASAEDRGVQAHAKGTVTEVDADAVTPAPAEPATPQPAPATATPAAPAPEATASAPATPPAAPDTAATATEAPSGDNDTEQHDDLAVPLTAAATGLTVLALLTLLTLRRRRARQQQHRRPGRRIAQPVDGTSEARLRVAATPTDLDRLDVALRHLAAGLADRPDDQWPDAVAAWLEHGTINLVLTNPCPAGPPPPWQADGDTIWTLPAAQSLPAASDQLAPLPTLVALGSQPEQHLLVELERLGMLTLTGDRPRVLDLLRYIAGELAHNHWSDDVYVTLAGFDPDQARLLRQLNPDRITVAETIETAVAKLRRQFDDTRTALDATGTPTTVHGRGTDDSGDAWPPHVLLIAEPDPDLQPLLADLEQLLTTHPSSGFAAVVTGGDQPHGRWPVTVTADGALGVSFLTDSPLTASALPADMLQPLADLLQAADIVTDEPVPPAPDTEEWAAGTDAAGGLRDMLDVDEAHDSDEPDDDREQPTAADTPGEHPAPPVKSPVPITARTDTHGPAAWKPVDSVLITLPATPVDPAVAERRRRDREQRDPHLDADLTAWTSGDLSRPRIAILGPVEIQAPGTTPRNRQRFYAEFVVYLASRGARGATAAQLEDAIWREQDASSSTRRSAISRARTWLGDTADGGKWLPLMAGSEQLYRIADGYLFDWALFRRLRARGEARGDDGAADLRQALELVRGAPFAGVQDAYTGDRIAYAWLPDSDIAPTHLVAAIVDTAHQLINLCLAADDITGARWALERAWHADPDRHEAQPWRDAMRIAHADGRDAELKALLHDLMRHVDAADTEDLDPGTYQLVRRLMPYPHRAAS
ncbi:LysM peptidoglycan-binding domain-containing protein [Actinoplanes sp. G11-F43]|uniref:LysM peptidoglycan-binding domain-containing protein n=1 Tax=Actinoplanes sp. G11-F43 TaxID=3424130 RepID=UPI003D338383